jgi:hypothetical protein
MHFLAIKSEEGIEFFNVAQFLPCKIIVMNSLKFSQSFSR